MTFLLKQDPQGHDEIMDGRKATQKNEATTNAKWHQKTEYGEYEGRVR